VLNGHVTPSENSSKSKSKINTTTRNAMVKLVKIQSLEKSE
jgi:hypothetical protein